MSLPSYTQTTYSSTLTQGYIIAHAAEIFWKWNVLYPWWAQKTKYSYKLKASWNSCFSNIYLIKSSMLIWYFPVLLLSSPVSHISLLHMISPTFPCFPLFTLFIPINSWFSKFLSPLFPTQRQFHWKFLTIYSFFRRKIQKF